MKPKYRVSLTEYELGWGQKHFQDQDFDSKKEADEFSLATNSKNNLPVTPDYFIKASDPFFVDADEYPPK